MTRDALRYGYAVGKVGVLRARVLDRTAYERVLDARSFDEQKRLLSETMYGRYLERATTAEQVEAALDTALDDSYAFLDDAALPEDVVRFFRLRYDFANVKAAAKARLFGVPARELLVGHGTIPREAFEGDLSELPEPFGPLSAALPTGASPTGEGAAEVEAGQVAAEAIEGETLALDTAVDRAMFAELAQTARRARSQFLLDLAQAAIDIANVRTLVRGRRLGFDHNAIETLLIDGGKVAVERLQPLAELAVEELPAALERIPELRRVATPAVIDPARIDVALDAITTAAMRGAVLGKVGPEPVISYVLLREAEVAALRVLLLGKLAGIGNETLRARLRAVA